MIKLYNAKSFHNDIVLEKGIIFHRGKFETGLPVHSYGDIKATGISMHDDDIRVLYERQKLNIPSYKNWPKEDGFLMNFHFYEPYTADKMREITKNIKPENYERFSLIDEAILLFTSGVKLDYDYPNSSLITQVFGRVEGTGGYILLPSANFEMKLMNNLEPEGYEVIQSNNLVKQLYLVKKDR